MSERKSEMESASQNAAKEVFSIRVWDIPTRLFHWLLVALVAFSFLTGNIGGTAMRYHEWSGFAVLVLVVFRLVWGFVGGEQSRSSSPRHAAFAQHQRSCALRLRTTNLFISG